MRIVVALGGNALLVPGEPSTAENQRRNVKLAAKALAPLANAHELTITHGNGPQVGLLAMQGLAYRLDEVYPLDILDAETEGQIGYLIEQELTNALPPDRQCAALLTQIEVDRQDPAFKTPTKPIGPFYSEAEAQRLSRQWNWEFARDGEQYRRIVPSPRPRRIFEMGVIELLVGQGVIVICAGGGGIPVIRVEDNSLIGVEAVIDKDLASSLLARQLKADALLMLTNVDAVYKDWGAPEARSIRHISAEDIKSLSFAPGTMGPKVEAACEFADTGEIAGIGLLQDAAAILAGKAGTLITRERKETSWWN